MLRFSLFMIAAMSASICIAGDHGLCDERKQDVKAGDECMVFGATPCPASMTSIPTNSEGDYAMTLCIAKVAAKPCSVDTIPIQTASAGFSPITSLSIAQQQSFFPRRDSTGDEHFRAFVTAVTEHAAARLARENLCLNSTESQERSLIQFVNWPLYHSSDRPLAPVPPLKASSTAACQITSPWMDLIIERKPVPSIRAIVRWNERQILADQAVLAGAKNVPKGVAKPISNVELGRFMDEYNRDELTAKSLEKRVPPDILWLLYRFQSRMPAGWVSDPIRNPRDTMYMVTEKSVESYTKVVTMLIDRCFDAEEKSLHYNSISDVADPVLLKQYKIDMPIR
jgi:hypothetical protein